MDHLEDNDEQKTQKNASEDFNEFKESAEDLVKSLAETGASLFTFARSRFEQTINEMKDGASAKVTVEVEDGDEDSMYSEDSAANVIDNFKEEAEKAKDNFEGKLKDITSTLKDRFDVPSRAEFDALQARVNELEAMLRGDEEEE